MRLNLLARSCLPFQVVVEWKGVGNVPFRVPGLPRVGCNRSVEGRSFSDESLPFDPFKQSDKSMIHGHWTSHIIGSSFPVTIIPRAACRVKLGTQTVEDS